MIFILKKNFLTAATLAVAGSPQAHDLEQLEFIAASGGEKII